MIKSIKSKNIWYSVIFSLCFIVLLLFFSIPDWDGTIIDAKDNSTLGIIYLFNFLFFWFFLTLFIILETKKINKIFFGKYLIFVLIAIVLAILPTIMIEQVGNFRLQFTPSDVENGDANSAIFFLTILYLCLSAVVILMIFFSVNLIITLFKYYDDPNAEFINKNIWFLIFKRGKYNIDELDRGRLSIEINDIYFNINLYNPPKEELNNDVIIQFSQQILIKNKPKIEEETQESNPKEIVYDLMDEFIDETNEKNNDKLVQNDEPKYETISANNLGSKIEKQKSEYLGNKIFYNFFIIPNIFNGQIIGESENFYLIYQKNFKKNINTILKENKKRD